MTRTRDIATMATLLAACGGPPVVGQTAPADATGIGRIHMYEVPAGQAVPTQEAGFIEVSGTGSVEIAPDLAHVAFAMETRAGTANDAAGQNADAMEAVLRAVRAGGFPGLELATFGYSLRPEYSVNNNRTREIVGYTALNNIRATISDVDMVGGVIDTAIGSGANRVESIQFSASSTESARAEALAQAVANARAQASVIAESLGHELGAPLEVRGGSQRPVPVRADMAFMASAEMARAAPTPIEAGGQTVTASVTIRFALGPELGGR